MNQPVGQSLGMTPPPGLMQGPPISGPVAILLPLTGRMADVGRPMLRAAQLALSVPGSPMLDAKDTGGTPEGAVQAAAEAIQAGDRLILGPVTSSETAQVAPVARRGAVPVLAFTNDSSQAQPGVWTLGITPGQQVRRLWAAARDSNHLPIAAILPDNDFGRAMGDELTRVTAAAGQPAPFTRMIGSGAEAINGAVNELAGLAPADQPPQYGALMLASIGNDLKIFAKAIADAKIDRARVQILGPALWVDPASGSSALPGAWFAMPDPEARRDMVRDYTAKYKEPPRPVADLAYDAASIARVLSSQGRMTMQGLVQPQGFTGVDGWFALLPEGQVRRGLAVFRVGRQPAEKIADAPGGPTS
jgi:branched-chain amino acid transport system substrate-binding protein